MTMPVGTANKTHSKRAIKKAVNASVQRHREYATRRLIEPDTEEVLEGQVLYPTMYLKEVIEGIYEMTAYFAWEDQGHLHYSNCCITATSREGQTKTGLPMSIAEVVGMYRHDGIPVVHRATVNYSSRATLEHAVWYFLGKHNGIPPRGEKGKEA